jgi:protoporphyrinogen oxidase
MRIAIIGAGFAGLTVALKLSQKGHYVTIFEKEKRAGGLAGGFKETNCKWPLDFFYHHLFTNDKAAKKLLKELEIKILWAKPKTSILKNNQIYRFDSPISILSFPFFSLSDKIHLSLASLYLKITNYWQPLEKITAVNWLKKFYGGKTYQVLWKPLLKSKFSKSYKQIPASWFWARIKKRTTSLGYPQGGFQFLANQLVSVIKKNGGQFYFQKEIKSFNELEGRFDKTIFTVPVPIFLKIMGKKLPQNYQQDLKQLKIIGAVYLILILKKPFLTGETYWLNVNDSSFPFVAMVEHTNFINKSHYNHHSILYIGGYYSQDHRYFKMKKEDIFKEWLPYIQKIRPDFNLSSFAHYSLFTNSYAQPIISLNYSKIIPSYQTPVKDVFLACMQQVYPWDRGVNYAIELGQKIAKKI